MGLQHVVIGGMLILSATFIGGTFGEEFAPATETEQLVEPDFLEEGEITGDLVYDEGSDLLYAEPDSSGEWTSFNYEFPNSVDAEWTVVGDDRDGSGSLTLEASNETDSVSETVELVRGSNTENLDVSNFTDLQLVAELEETAGNSNERPNIEEISLSVRSEQSAVGSDDIGLVVTLLLMLLGLMVMAAPLYT